MIDQTAVEISLSAATTEALEQELKDRSEALSRHQARFAQVRDELKRRRETKDEQPPMQVVTIESQQKADVDLNRTLALKVPEMEDQQAKLVVEAEIAKAAQREAEDRLALVIKHLPDKHDPKLKFSALEYGEHFICWPVPGDNSGHGGYLGTQRLFMKTGDLTASNGSGTESSMNANMNVIRITLK